MAETRRRQLSFELRGRGENKLSDVYFMQGILRAVASSLLRCRSTKGTTFHPQPSKILIDT
jgi:hypothetical protein